MASRVVRDFLSGKLHARYRGDCRLHSCCWNHYCRGARVSKKYEREAQWKLVEHIVAALFDDPDVQVQSNVRLPAIRRTGSKSGRREIDVLITGSVAGQRIRVPIECKHLRRKVGSQEIDGFVGKLLDIGLPSQTSIFVSTSGYTSGGLARAQEAGVRTLVLSGANLDRTREQILEAMQSQVYVCCHLAKLQFQTPGELDEQDLLFFDLDGAYVGSLQDFLWQGWINGTPPLVCGTHSYTVEVPDEWMHAADGSPKQLRNIRVDYEVFALVREYRGQAAWHRLTDAGTGALERQNVELTFERARGIQVPCQFNTENELAQHLSSRPASASLTIGRQRLPKLAMHKGLLWPVPAEVIERFGAAAPEDREGEMEQFRESASNNFWNFDEAYASVLTQAQGEAWVEFVPIV